MRLQRRLLFSITLLVLLGQIAIAREWTDATGKHKTEAELVKVEGGTVFLKKQSDGATIQVQLARLSVADQAYLKSLQSPTAELTATGGAPSLPLHTAGCVGLMVVDPKPVFQQTALSQPPLKGLIEKGVAQAGIDFRKLDRVTVFFLKPNSENMASNETNAVAVAEFSTPVDPASMLSKIPTSYVAATVAGKASHKPASAPNPWVCVIDDKTLAFAADEKSLAAMLTATSDDADLAKLLGATDEKNEVRYVLNIAPMKDLLAKARTALPPEAADGAKAIEVVEKIDSSLFTIDLDGTPSIEILLQTGSGAKVADVEKEIRNGLAKLPEMMQTASAAAAQQAPQAGAPQMNPAMMTQMLGGMSKGIEEKLAFEQAGSDLKISVKFPPDSAPLVQTLVQAAGFLAMMSQQSGAGGPSAPPK